MHLVLCFFYFCLHNLISRVRAGFDGSNIFIIIKFFCLFVCYYYYYYTLSSTCEKCVSEGVSSISSCTNAYARSTEVT